MPAASVSATRRRASARSASAAVLVFFLGMFATWGFGRQQAASNALRASRAFDRLADEAVDGILRRVHLYEYGLRGARGAIAAVGLDVLTRERFAAYAAARDLEREFPGARGLGFVRRVPAADEAAFVARARRDGASTFAVHGVAPHAGERFVVQYVEPEARNAAAIGFDLASDAARCAAALAALASGEPRLSAPITLVQASGNAQQSFLLLLPVYAAGAAPATPEARASAGAGWVYVPLVTEEVLAGLLPRGSLALAVSDREAAGAPAMSAPFYRVEPSAPRAGPAALREASVYGRRWRFEFAATQAFVDSLALTPPGTVYAVGAVASALCAALAGAAALARTRRLEMAAQRAQLATISENSSDAIVAAALDGTIGYWNRAAESLFGWRAGEAVGRSLPELLVPAAGRAQHERAFTAIATGRPAAAFDALRLHRDGTPIEVSITAGPIADGDGRTVGVAMLIRDERARRRHETTLREFNARLEREVAERTAELERARHDMQTVFDAMPSMIGYWDRELRNRVANRAYADWFGIDPESLPGTTLPALLGPEIYERSRPYVEAALRGEPQRFERPMQLPGGRGTRDALVQYLPDWEGGGVRGFYVLVHDVSELMQERRRVEAQGVALADALREHRALFDAVSAHALYSATEVDGTIVEVNENFCRVSGHARAELIGANHRLVASGMHAGPFWAEVYASVAAGRAWRGEICNRRRDGTLYWVDAVIAPLPGADGLPRRYLSLSHEITARKEAEAALALEQSRLADSEDFARRAGRVAGIGGWKVDLGASLVTLDDDACRLYGVPAGTRMTRAEAASYFAPEAHTVVAGSIERALAGGAGWDHELPFVDAQGRERWMRSVGEAVRDPQRPDAPPLRLVGALQDVSERHAAAVALREAKEAAEAANVAKSEFLANTSHEIRTPLSAVLGIAEMLADSTLDERQRALLAKMQIAGRALLGIVDDVLDLAKIEAGALSIDPAPFDPAALLDEVHAMFAPAAQAKGIALELRAPELPPVLRGDALRLRQIVSNLVGNAIKFTAHGHVRVEAHVVEQLGTRLRLRFTVRDSGIGIEADRLARLFRPFSQADASTTRRYGGTGLGLSIVLRLAQLMGGDAGAQSTPGEGSEFWVQVLLEPIEGAGPAAAADADVRAVAGRALPGLRVMVVDDSEINLEIARHLLERSGALVQTEASGTAALAALAAAPGACDALLIDLQMPELDGLEVTRRLRRDPRLATLPVVALTAGALADERRRALDAGVDEFLTKPVDPAALVRALRAAVERARGRPWPRGEAPPAAVAPAWPSIDGIASGDALARLGGEPRLFVALLERLLGESAEFADAPPAVPDDDAARLALAARVHRLGGAAGQLGATDVHRHAKAAEAALRAGDAPAAGATLQTLGSALAEVRRASAPARAEFAASRSRAPERAVSPIDAATLATLVRLIAQRDLAALDLFDAHADALRAAGAAGEFEPLQAAMVGLDFARAERLLGALGPRG